MGLTSALGIGRTALAAYQAALQVAGQNIANVATPGYTRTSADLSAVPGTVFTAGQLGNGVRITSVRRNISEALQSRLRTATSDRSSAGAERGTMGRLESILDPLGGSNLGSLISEFFGAIGDLQNTPENVATRGIVVNTGVTLAQRINDIRRDIVGLRDELNAEILNATGRGDELASAIAELNTQIVLAEAGSSGPSSALRDQRDQLLGELSQLFDIVVREQPAGAINVYIGNEALVQFGDSFGLTTQTQVDNQGMATISVHLKINNGPVTPQSGSVEGLITSRDSHTQSQLDQLDALTAALINELNKAHSGGQGLEGFNDILGLTQVIDPTVALNTADNGLAFLPQTGSFFIDVKDDATGAVVRTQINVDLDGIGTDTTLDSLAADITANVANVTATVLPNGRLQLTAAAGSSFTFADDTSGTLAALQINTFFTGSNSRDIAVNDLLINNHGLLAAATGNASGIAPGDGSNATNLSLLQDAPIASLGGASLNEYYTATLAGLAVTSSAVNGAEEAATIIFESLTVQRESISGVNLDEEAVSLISFQRAYEGAARYMRVVDEMLQTLLSLAR